MLVLKWITYFLFITVMLLCLYFVGKQKMIHEGNINIDDTTVFAKNVGDLTNRNSVLNDSLDKLNNIYGDLKSQEQQSVVNDNKIKDKQKELDDIQKQINDEYKLIANSVQPIMFLKFDSYIRNDAITDKIIDTKINGILEPTPYNKIIASQSSVILYQGKNCLQINGSVNQFVVFLVIPTLKQFSFSFWIYNDTNTNNNDPVISIMNHKDFDNKVANSGLKLYIKNNKVELYYYDNITLISSPLINKWNHITFTTSETNSNIYVNGKDNISSIYKATPIQPQPNSYDTLYRLNTGFIIGGTSFKGYIYNIRYYVVQIPSKLVKEIYKLDGGTIS